MPENQEHAQEFRGYRRQHSSHNHQSRLKSLTVLEDLGAYLQETLYSAGSASLTPDQKLELAKRILECVKERREIYDRIEKDLRRGRLRTVRKPKGSAVNDLMTQP